MAKFQTSDHVRLEYDDLGSGIPVVILTGIGGCRQIWTNQIAQLTASGFRVINVDARNQGASQRTSKGLRISRHAMDVYELIHHLKLERPFLLGNSMGAATFFAYVSLVGDDGIRGLIDVDQSPKMINDETWSYGFHNLTWETFPELLKFPLGPATNQPLDDQLYREVKQAQRAHPYDSDLNRPLLIDHAFQDWRDVIHQFRRPLLVIAGQKSPYFNSAFAAKTAKMAEFGQSVVVSECGHIVMAEQPQRFNHVLMSFIESNC